MGRAKLHMLYTCGMGKRRRGGEGTVDGGGGSGRREVGVEGGYKRAMGRLMMAEWVKRRQGCIQVEEGRGNE